MVERRTMDGRESWWMVVDASRASRWIRASSAYAVLATGGCRPLRLGPRAFAGRVGLEDRFGICCLRRFRWGGCLSSRCGCA